MQETLKAHYGLNNCAVDSTILPLILRAGRIISLT
jgi:hypothetical protein